MNGGSKLPPKAVGKKAKPVSSVTTRQRVKDITEHRVDDDVPELEVTPNNDL